MKRSSIIFTTLCLFAAMSCTPDEAGMKEQMDKMATRLEAIQESIQAINAQVEALGTITQGNAITGISQDSDGNYVISYKASDDQEYCVVVATKEQMVNAPQLGVRKDVTDNIYYWSIIDPDGTENDLLDKNGHKVPVSGTTPKLSTDADGYWTVDGVRLLDASSRPIPARDGQTCIFQSIGVNEDGDMEVVLGGGKTIVLPMQQVLNLTLSQPINGARPATLPGTLEITYSVTGSAALDAIVALSGVSGLTATLDKDAQKVTLDFPAGFTSGYIVLVAYDMGTHSVIRPVFFGENTTPDPPTPPASVVEIGTAAQLVSFAQAVNAQDGSESKTAVLTADINLSSVSSWTPIGKATSASGSWDGTNFKGSFSYSGPAFKGTFNGQGHTISGFNTTSSSTTGVWGLFGVLDGATVKNLNVTGAMTVTASGELSAGGIAGAMVNSTLESCSTDIAFSMTTSTTGKRMIAGGLAGFVISKGEGRSAIRSCKASGDLVSGTKSGNTSTGFDCVAYGGIVALTTATSSAAPLVLVDNCEYTGNMTAKTALARCAGIVANGTFCQLNACVNRGNQRNTGSGGRIGNVASYLYGSQMTDCWNYGSLTTTQTDTECGGLAGLVGGATTTITGGGNRGVITSACTTVGTASGDNIRVHRGLLFANLASFGSVDGLSAGGSLWNYNGGSPTRVNVNTGNYMDYIGRYTDANASKITNISCDVEEVTAGISSAADFAEFASLVNSGASYAQFQAADGSVNLMVDIDLSGVSANWTPIGSATATTTDDISIDVSGHPFTGVFNGGGHSITGFNPSKTTGSAGTFGLFGVLKGASVSNFTLSGAMTVSATAKSHVGCVAGAAINSTISEVTCSVSVTSSGTTQSDQRFAIGGIVGLVANDGSAATNITNCTMNGNANVVQGSNTGIGVTAVTYGGIVGFASATAGTHSVITGCVNNGNMTVKLGRCAGIVGSMKQYTRLNNCTNNGTQTNSSASNRLGQICCNLESNSWIKGCVNNGDIIATGTAASADDIRLGGIVGAVSAGTVEGGGNFARVITNGHEKNAGLIFGYISNCTAVKSVSVKGLIGTYNGGNYQMKNVTDENFDVWNDITVGTSSRKYSFLGCSNTSKYTLVTDCIFVP